LGFRKQGADGDGCLCPGLTALLNLTNELTASSDVSSPYAFNVPLSVILLSLLFFVHQFLAIELLAFLACAPPVYYRSDEHKNSLAARVQPWKAGGLTFQSVLGARQAGFRLPPEQQTNNGMGIIERVIRFPRSHARTVLRTLA
jgi:hypothetical protein